MSLRIILALALILWFGRPACADECTDPKTAAAVTQCLDESLRASDVSMNAAYSQLASRLGDAERKELQSAQRAWIRRRDTACGLNERVTDRELWYRNVLSSYANATCARNYTRDRAVELERLAIEPTPSVKVLDHSVGLLSSGEVRGVVYAPHIGDSKLWQGVWAGTKDESNSIEGFSITLDVPLPELHVEYMCHLQNVGDRQWMADGAYCGTRGESRRLEGFAIRLTGVNAAYFDIVYSCHPQALADMSSLKNGAFCGTRGQSRPLSAMQVWLIPKPAPEAAESLPVPAPNPYMQTFRGMSAAIVGGGNGSCDTALSDTVTDNLRASAEELQKQGFTIIGSSSFNAPEQLITDTELREQAKRLGACSVLAWSHYTETVPDTPSNAHLILPGHWYREGTMSYFLPGYPSSHSYGASAQTPSSGIRRFDYAAVYFAKRKLSLGIWWDSLDPATRQRLPPDSGLRAGVVVAGSPAARAGILAGDIILSVDGVPVNSHETIAPQLAAHMGEIIVVEVDRDGQRMEMKVALNTE